MQHQQPGVSLGPPVGLRRHGVYDERRTVGADKAYDVQEFIDVTRELGCTPHVAQNLNRPGGSAIDGRTTRHASYAMSQHARPRIEPPFGWLKTIGWMRKVKLRGLEGGELPGAGDLSECAAAATPS